MENGIFCLYDRLANRYTDLFVSPNRITALVRLREAKVNSEYFDLLHVGSLAVETGKLTVIDPVRVPFLADDENPIDRMETM